jgi:hypothetical protein
MRALKEMNMNIYYISTGVFTDAGGWYIGPDGKIHPVPPWNPDAMRDLAHAVNIIGEAGRVKTPGVADAWIKNVMGFAQKELETHLKGGGVLVIR